MAISAETSVNPNKLGLLFERVERLLLRHEEQTRTHHLLTQELDALKAERDLLKSRLLAARARIDSLIERLPENSNAEGLPEFSA